MVDPERPWRVWGKAWWLPARFHPKWMALGCSLIIGVERRVNGQWFPKVGGALIGIDGISLWVRISRHHLFHLHTRHLRKSHASGVTIVTGTLADG